MPTEPLVKRAVVFIDGQNLYHSVRESFGYTYPNYDVVALSRSICQTKGWPNEVDFFVAKGGRGVETGTLVQMQLVLKSGIGIFWEGVSDTFWRR